MRDEKRQEVAAWMTKAENDLRTARVLTNANPPLVEPALFHCQQAAEKAMKAFLTAHDRPFRKTHDLDELASACETINATLRPVLDPARELTVFAWEFRYPGDGETPPESAAHDAIEEAHATIREVWSHLLHLLHESEA